LSQNNQVHIINSLRAIAALMVCFFHFIWHEDNFGSLLPAESTIKQIGYYGHHGVNVFFVISGFVIPLAMYYGKYKIEYFVKFISKRMVRLHPPFIASMLLYGVMEYFYWLKGGYVIIYDWGRIAHNFFLTAKIFNESWFQDVYWTLAIELQYYLVIALIFPIIIHQKKWISNAGILIMLALCFFFGHDQKHYFFFHTPVFMFGVVLFLHHIKRINTFELAVFTFYSMWLIYYEITPACVIAALGTGICIYAVKWRSKFLEWSGQLSYSLYLTHAFSGGQLLYYFAHHAVTLWQKVGLIVTSVAISIGFAYLFYRMIEVPSVNWSQKIRYKKTA